MVSSSEGTTPSPRASTVMPRKSVPRITAIHAGVMAAFRDSGGLNAGIPLEIASTPVRAVQPEENARRTRNHVNAVVAAGGGVGSGRRSPLSQRRMPVATRTPNVTMKRYVGSAKTRPDSLTPRRLAKAMAAMKTTPRATLWLKRPGAAAARAGPPPAAGRGGTVWRKGRKDPGDKPGGGHPGGKGGGGGAPPRQHEDQKDLFR